MSARPTLTNLYNVRFMRVLPYLAIPIALYCFMVLAPLAGAVYYSLNHVLASFFTFVGLKNYAELIRDSIFWLSLRNNVILILVSIFFQVGPAFVVMAMMATNLVRGREFVRSIFFFPVVISPLVTAYIWKVMFSPEFGIINDLLAAVGLKSLQQDWLGNAHVIMVSISIPLAWQYIGFYLVILLAGFTSIDRELLEAAEIDGASGITRTTRIILPLMRNTISVSVLLCVSGGIKIFDQVYAMSAGGPGYASSVLAMYAFDTSFTEAEFGYGAAISVAMLIIGFLVVAVLTLTRRGETNE